MYFKPRREEGKEKKVSLSQYRGEGVVGMTLESYKRERNLIISQVVVVIA